MNVGMVWILGGGPAGSAAAIAASSEGGKVRIVEKSRLPRHKVCGEFFAPEIFPLLERLGAWKDFWDNGPAIIRRLVLHFGSHETSCNLPEQAFGLSWYRFDHCY